MTCTLKEHYNKAHGMQMTTSELNKVCVKLPPGPINPPLSPSSHQAMQLQEQQEQQQETTSISLISIDPDIGDASIMTTISSPVNLAK